MALTSIVHHTQIIELGFDDEMMIKNGELIIGIVDKKTVGAQGGLVHIVTNR